MRWQIRDEPDALRGECQRCGHVWEIPAQNLKEIMRTRGSQGVVDACNRAMEVKCCELVGNVLRRHGSLPVSQAIKLAEAQLQADWAVAFHKAWYGSPITWKANLWCGVPCLQNPMDMWMIQEVISATRPDVIVETGSYDGGSAIAYSMFARAVNPSSSVISIDMSSVSPEVVRRTNGIIRFVVGSSVSPEVVAYVRKSTDGLRTMVVLDSDHFKEHVLQELNLYSPMVSAGCYIVVQDTNLNGHPLVTSAHVGPGPYEAVDEFLASPSCGFEENRLRQRLAMSWCRYLVRQSQEIQE